MYADFIGHIAKDMANLLESGPGYSCGRVGGSTVTNTTVLVEKPCS